MTKELYIEVEPFPDMTKEFFGYDVYSSYQSNSKKPKWELWARFWCKESNGLYHVRSKIIRVDEDLKIFPDIKRADFFLHERAKKFARGYESYSLKICSPFFYDNPVSIVSIKD